MVTLRVTIEKFLIRRFALHFNNAKNMKNIQLFNCSAITAIAASLLILVDHTQSATFINQRQCPPDFPRLSQALANALPDYLNRSYQRLRLRREVIAISQPELEPLPIAPDQLRDRLPQQIFLSVLEKEAGRTTQSQSAYWLFLVPTNRGWRLAMAFMRIGQAPPVDVSDAAIAEATNKWLRDYCDPRYSLPNQ